MVEVVVEVPLVEEAEVEQTVSRLVLEVLGPIRRRHLTIKSNEFQPPSPRATSIQSTKSLHKMSLCCIDVYTKSE